MERRARVAAALLLGIMLGSLALRDHAERLFGFEQAMATEHPQRPRS